ncbi:hypothetical protein SS1G_00012 [Sclerotinia sclerotiorum 1980 UF-70]|uniref:Mis6 domain protein n=1 Tax=Sclerotinia sclerotiorum (strain ATCC 18683 / 1980 / Ss-1) TaxID=665079 RepID=A7E3Z0_SCLS1|nr:hypothetical protein SS1G_00012 [Sclerotinia sclerotiorum 1980 UF-70]EDN90612.1 hypothetical protein SS1G_00012 [Sclerotinia sclerotiorum 1980 UF-70]
MESHLKEEQNIDDILDDLENASRIPSKQRSVKISSHVDRLCSRAYGEGLSNASLEKLMDIITLPNELDQVSIGNLIKYLYPTSKVSDSIVIKVVGSLGHGKDRPSYAAQAALLKWIVLVYDVLENQKILSQLYAVLFNLLDTIALRMQWTRKAGHDPALVGLMRVYKDYYPEVIHPNREWRERLGEIQEDHLRRMEEELVSTHRNFRVPRKTVRDRKHGFLPEVNTLYAQDILPSACLSYLKSLLPCWDGFTNRDVILELLAYIRIGSFDVRITIPPPQVVYTLYFSSNLSVIARTCNILALYKKAFEMAMAPRTNPAAPANQSYPKEYVNRFNGFLMDICNCLWRSRAFYTIDVNALGCLLPEQTMGTLSSYISKLETSLSLSSLFSISCSPAICRHAITYMRELEDQAEDEINVRHAGPVTQVSLKKLGNDGGLSISWQDYRLGVLKYLEGKGLPGAGELMYNTMKHLMAAREHAV